MEPLKPKILIDEGTIECISQIEYLRIPLVEHTGREPEIYVTHRAAFELLREIESRTYLEPMPNLNPTELVLGQIGPAKLVRDNYRPDPGREIMVEALHMIVRSYWGMDCSKWAFKALREAGERPVPPEGRNFHIEEIEALRKRLDALEKSSRANEKFK